MPYTIQEIRLHYDFNLKKLSRLDKQFLTFETDADEIMYFKNTRTKVFHKVIYYRELLRFETKFPMGTADTKKCYIEDWLQNLTFFFQCK